MLLIRNSFMGMEKKKQKTRTKFLLTNRAVSQMAQSVYAVSALSDAPLGLRLGHHELWIHVVQVPLEGFAVQLLLELQSVVDAGIGTNKRNISLEAVATLAFSRHTHFPNGIFLARGTEA